MLYQLASARHIVPGLGPLSGNASGTENRTLWNRLREARRIKLQDSETGNGNAHATCPAATSVADSDADPRIRRPAAATACPNCKEAVSAQPSDMADMARGYNWSVLVMLAVPFTLLGSGTLMVVRAARRGTLPEL